MKGTAGDLLREARESKNISVTQAANETNITGRHLRALEENNFGMFPGETYAVGFLRKYSDYLGLDSSRVIQLYKGSLLVEKEPPIAELTRPTITRGDHFRKLALPAILVLLVLGLVLTIYNSFFSGSTDETDSPDAKNYSYNEILKKSDRVPDVETDNIHFRSGYTTAIVTRDKGVNFSIENSEIYLVLKELNYMVADRGKSTATFEYYPGKKLIRISEGDNIQISEANQPRAFYLKMAGATPNNAKIIIALSNEVMEPTEDNPEGQAPVEDESRVTNPSNFIIVMNAEFTSNNFVEFYVDGKPRKKGELPAGSILRYEANESIQMKIGDAGGVKLTINNETFTLGKKGQTINKIVRKVKDPIEQTRYKIILKDL